MAVNKELYRIAVEATNRQNMLEDRIAMEWYGCSFDELDYDDREEVTLEALDRLNK